MMQFIANNFSKIEACSEFEQKRSRLAPDLNPPFDRYIHCEPFTELSELWREGVCKPDTPKKEIDDLREIFFRMHMYTPGEAVSTVWDETKDRFMKNPGFAAYYARFCMRSEWYPRWPLNVPTARAVVGPFGYGWDLEGNFGKIPITDDHAWWSEHHPVLHFIRKRAKNTARIIKFQHDTLARNGTLNNRKQRICVLSAGYIPWLTMLQAPRIDPATQSIIACDMDPSLNKAVLRRTFGKTAIKPIQKYHTCRNEDIFATESLFDSFDMVVMDGGLIYYPPPLRKGLVVSAMRLLRKDGIFVYDDQCQHWAMRFATSLFGWGIDQPIYLANSYTEIEENACNYADANPHIHQLGFINPISAWPHGEGIVGASIALTKE